MRVNRIPWLGLYVTTFLVFTIAPLLIVAATSFEPKEILRFPPEGFSLRWYSAVWNSGAFTSSAWTSLIIAVQATLGAVVLGVPAAYGLARYEFAAKSVVAGLLQSPLLVPELVLGLALLHVVAASPYGSPIAVLTIGHCLLCIPYVVRTVFASMLGINPVIEEAARSLGAGRLKIYTSIVLPLVRPAIIASACLSFMISFDNAVLSLFLVSGGTTTLPITIYNNVEYNLDPSISAVATILMLVSLFAVLAVSKLVPIEKLS